MKRVLWIVIVLLFPIVAISQKIQTDYLKNVDFDYSKLLKDAYRIMSILKFRIRDSIQNDGYLQPCVNVRRTHSLDAGFSYEPNDLVKSATDPSRYFIHAFLQMSVPLYQIISKQKDTTFQCYEKAESIVVHELTHYLQKTNDVAYIEANDENLVAYISQPSEFEAHSVGCYYFLEKCNRKELNRIMALKIPTEQKCRSIINAFWKIIYPKFGIPFPSVNK